MTIDRETNTVLDDADRQMFGIARSVRYHAKRERFYGSLDRWCKVFTTVMSLGTVGSLLKDNSDLGQWLAATAGVTGIVDLVFGFSAQAKKHLELGQEFVSLKQEYVRLGDGISRERLNELTARRMEVEKREPPVLHVLTRICHNEECHYRGQDEFGYEVSRWQQIFANYFDLFFREDAPRKGKPQL